jgi:predicted dehydrogenase
VDVDKKNLTVAATRHGTPKSLCFTDLDAALNSVKADALLDVTPQQCRKAVCCAAFKHGLHVMSEKPLADTLKNAQAVVACAAKYRRIYMVTQNYRYQAVVQTAKRTLAQGRIGEVGYASVDFHKGPHFGGFREQMAYPLVLDMSIHHFDMMRCMLDTDIVAVSAISIDAPWNWNKGEATVMAQLEMTNGAVVNYHGSWVATGWETPWNANWRFDGSKGVLLMENDRLAISEEPGKKRALPPIRFPKVHQAWLLDAFADALDSGEEPETSGRRNLNSLAATYAVVRAAKERRRVLLDELLTRPHPRQRQHVAGTPGPQNRADTALRGATPPTGCS